MDQSEAARGRHPSSREVRSFLKPDPIPCACGCGAVGRPRTKAWRDSLHHSVTCRCARCKAPTYRRAAAKRERAIAKDIGGERHALSGALSGVDVSSVIVEVEETSNVAVTRGIRRWFESLTVQRKIARLIAHGRVSGVPSALVLTWERRRRLVVMDYESFRALCKQRLDDDEVGA